MSILLESRVSEKLDKRSGGFSLKALLWLSFLLLVFSLGFMQPFVYIAAQRISSTDILFLLVTALWVVVLALGKVKLRWHSGYWFLAFYFLAMLMSSVLSQNPRSSFVKLIGEAYLIGLAVMTFNLVDRGKRMKQVLFAWLAGTLPTILVAFITVVLFYIQPDSWLLEYTTSIFGAVPVMPFPRVTSTFISASMFCNYLNVGVVLLIIMRQKEWIEKRTFWVAICLTVASSISTIAVGLGSIFLAIGLSVWSFNERQTKRIKKIVLFGAVLIASLFIGVSVVALQYHTTAEYSVRLPFVGTTVYPSSRLMVWTESLKTFEANFFFGNGLNQPSCSVLFQNTDGNFSLLTDAHNTYLSVASQNGIVGLLAIVALCGFLLRTGLKQSSESDSTILTGLTIAFFTSFVYFGLTGSFEDTRHQWVLIGLLLSSSKLGRGPQ